MEGPAHRLSISCAQPGAVFRVTDGRSARVGTGMYRLELDLPPGLYTVGALLGASFESKTVLLDRPKAVEIEVPHCSFGDVAFAMMPRIRAQLAPTYFAPGATTVVAVRGPFREAPSKKHRITIDVDRTPVEASAADAMTDDAGRIWQWQVFRVDDAAPGQLGIITAVRAVKDVKTSHVIPRFGNWMVWAAYPAPKELALEDVELPPPHYVRLRLTQSGLAPDMGLQSLSDQLFTALASRSALPLSPPVLDLLFAKDADPLLAVAAAHVASLKLSWYGLLERLPQDQIGGARQVPTEARTPAHETEPVPPDELRDRITNWLQENGSNEAGHFPDMVAVRFVYGRCDEINLLRPPVLLRSLDALIKAEHAASESGRKCQLGDSVWRTRFQVSDSFAYLQWETDEKKSAQKRLQVLAQSFKIAQDFETSVQELQQSIQRKDETSNPPQKASADAAEAEAPQAAQAMQTNESSAETFAERVQRSAALGRVKGTDVLAKITRSPALRRQAANELENYLKMNAQALRLPSSALGGLASQILKSRAFKK